MEQKNEQNQESPKQTQGNRGYQPINESKINWQELEEKWGVKRDDLEKSGDLNRMLNYGKSDLVRVSPNFGGEAFELDARLSFKRDGEGNVSLVPHFIRKEQKLDEDADNTVLSPDERKEQRLKISYPTLRDFEKWMEDILRKLPYYHRDGKDISELLPQTWAESATNRG